MVLTPRCPAFLLLSRLPATSALRTVCGCLVFATCCLLTEPVNAADTLATKGFVSGDLPADC